MRRANWLQLFTRRRQHLNAVTQFNYDLQRTTERFLTVQEHTYVNPAIVCCSLTGFGMTGPRSAEPAYDYVLQALAGWMSLTGEPDGPPVKSGLSLCMEGRHVFEHLTVHENLVTGAYSRRGTSAEDFDLVYTYFPRLADMRNRFVYLQEGLAIILAFVGVKMLVHEWYHIPTWLSLTVIV